MNTHSLLKFLLNLSLFFIFSSSFGQGLSNEIGYNLEHYQRLTALTTSDDAGYYAISYTSSGFASYAILYKADSAGEEIWAVPFNAIWVEVSEITDLMVYEDHLYVIGWVRECCDCSNAYGFAAKYTLDGDLVWIYDHAGPFGEWVDDTYGRNLHIGSDEFLVYELESWNGSGLARVDLNGNLIDSVAISLTMSNDISSLQDGSTLFLQDSMLYEIESTGLLADSAALSAAGINVMSIGDSVLVLQPEGIEILNSELEPIDLVEPWSDGQALSFKITDDGYVVHLQTTTGISILDLDSDLESITEQLLEMDLGPSPFFDSNPQSAYLLEQHSLTEQQSVRYRAFDRTEPTDQGIGRSEVEPLALQLDEADILTYPYDDELIIVTIGLDLSVLIKNNGPNEVTSCRFNRYLDFGICALAYYGAEIDMLSIPPGDSAWVDLGYTGFHQNIYPIGDTISHTACIFTSNPNNIVDLEVSNDEICEVFQFIVTDIEEYEDFPFKVFPNPTSDILTIEGLSAGTVVRLFDLNGRLIHSETYNGSFLDLNSIEAGTYLLDVQLEQRNTRARRITITPE